jgi:IS30 family transposase
MVSKIPNQYKKTITFDKRLENAKHETICNELNIRSYFCNPYHSWEEGAVENTIGLIRRYYPKKTNLKLISNDELEMLFLMLNSRPRKSLNFLTPFEAFEIAQED